MGAMMLKLVERCQALRQGHAHKLERNYGGCMVHGHVEECLWDPQCDESQAYQVSRSHSCQATCSLPVQLLSGSNGSNEILRAATPAGLWLIAQLNSQHFKRRQAKENEFCSGRSSKGCLLF